jgi:hypothetical protein
MTKFEYIAPYIATKEIMWMWQLLSNLGYPQLTPTCFFYDNQSSIWFIHNLKFHKHMKHIDVKFHFIWEKQTSTNIIVYYVSMTIQVVDLFIKALPSDRFHWLCTLLNMVSL